MKTKVTLEIDQQPDGRQIDFLIISIEPSQYFPSTDLSFIASIKKNVFQTEICSIHQREIIFFVGKFL
jgi:hypothetical protein